MFANLGSVREAFLVVQFSAKGLFSLFYCSLHARIMHDAYLDYTEPQFFFHFGT